MLSKSVSDSGSKLLLFSDCDPDSDFDPDSTNSSSLSECSYIQDMFIEHKTGKGALENQVIPPGDIRRHDVFFAFHLYRPGGGHYGVAYFYRLQEAGLGAAQDDIRAIDGNHGRVVGQAENETAMHQAGFVNSHIGAGFHGHAAVAVSGLIRNAAQSLVDLRVGLDLHSHLAENKGDKV